MPDQSAPGAEEGLGTAEAIGAIADSSCPRALASGSRGGMGHCRWVEGCEGVGKGRLWGGSMGMKTTKYEVVMC